MRLLAALRIFGPNQRGAIAVEFAFIAIPLLLLLIGSLEISRLVWTHHALQDAAANGARCVGLRNPPCVTDGISNQATARGFVQEKAAGWIVFIAAEAVTVEEIAECNGVSGFSRVTVRHEFYSVLNVLTGGAIETEACFPLTTLN